MSQIINQSDIEINTKRLKSNVTFKPRLDLFIGPMNSDKTTSLVMWSSKFADFGLNVCYINSTKDNRAQTPGTTFSSNKSSIMLTPTNKSIHYKKMEFLSSLDIDSYDVIAIDESHFFIDLLIVRDWVNKGKIVGCVGLNGDYMQMPIGGILDLIPFSESVSFKHAICQLCNNETPASFSIRLTTEKEQLISGGKDKYMSVCREHLRS